MTRATESMCRPLHNKRGQSLALVGIGLGTAAFLALAVVAVDIGRLTFTATEVQTVADATAMAGAIALMNSADVTTAANTVARGNTIDGTSAVVPCSGGSPCADLTLGTLNFTTWNAGGCSATSLDSCFTGGGATPNAVRSTAQATVNNILAAMLGSSTSTVAKTAVGAIGGLGSGTPTLPLALCSACFPNDCLPNTGCTLPAITNAPNGLDNAAWTSFSSANTNDTLSFFPTACKGGGGQAPPMLTAGSSTINLTNGQLSGVFDAVQCMVCDQGISQFLVPVFQCDSCTGTSLNPILPVVGFATIQIQSFNFSNHQTGLCDVKGGQINGINLDAIFSTDVTGPPSGGLFGTIVAGMVG